jgi:hypothetical protein
MTKQLTEQDPAEVDTQRRQFEDWSDDLTNFGDVVLEIKIDAELPDDIEFDLTTVESCLLRVADWLRDELWKQTNTEEDAQ